MTTSQAFALLVICGVAVSAQQPATTVQLTAVRPIEPPDHPLPQEAASASVSRFSFIAYGDTRGQADGLELQAAHTTVVDAMFERIAALAPTPFPVRFILQSGDAVSRGGDGKAWNVSFTPIVERLTRGAGIPFFFAVGNHDVTGMPPGDPGRMLGLHNTLSAISRLVPAEGSPRRLSGYPTYAFGFGNVFVIAFDSNIAADLVQLAWVADQLEHLDRRRYTHVIAFFHHPVFSSGPHGGLTIEPNTLAIRNVYAPLFRRHHVAMTITGHDHLFDHWVERYDEAGNTYRMDHVVTGGGGAPTYTYREEPDLDGYVADGAAERVRVEHLARPGAAVGENPHHFVVVQVDGDRLWLDVVAAGGVNFAPYNGRSRIALSDKIS